jgi:hypothetical protein
MFRYHKAKTVSHFAALLVASTLALAPVPSIGHEGHSHGVGAEAPHGGMVKEGKNFVVEVVPLKTELEIFFYTKGGQDIPIKDVEVKATAQPPKKAKTDLKLTPSGDHYKTSFDAKGAYRYELVIQAKLLGPNAKPGETLKFQIEPPK